MGRKFIAIATIFLGASYSIVIFLVGVIFVPYTAYWGPQKEIERALYATIWSNMDNGHEINGYKVIYQIDSDKLLLELLVITLIMIALYYILHGISKLLD